MSAVTLVLRLSQGAGLCFLLGCGVQGPPQPPRVEVPERVTDLRVLQVGRTLELRFALPQQTEDGERLTNPLEVDILRALLSTASPTPSSPVLALWVGLQPGQWSHFAEGGRVIYPARLSEEDFKNWQAEDLLLGIRTLTRGFHHRPLESGISNLVRLRLLDVSGPVSRVEARITETAIELRWQPAAKTLEGKDVRGLAGYRIYRSLSGKPGSFQMLGESKDPRYLDSDFEIGQAYSYQVRALFKAGDTAAESESSQPYEVLPRDVFPPLRPTGLTALYTAGAVELVWTANAEKDLAGYFVYRHENGGQPKKLNKDLLRTPILRDISVQPGHSYIYQVTAVDLSGNESQPSEEVEVEAKN